MTLVALLRRHTLHKCFALHEHAPALDIVYLPHTWQKTERIKSRAQSVIYQKRNTAPHPGSASRTKEADHIYNHGRETDTIAVGDTTS